MNDPVSNTSDNISKRTLSCASRHVKLHIYSCTVKGGIDFVKDEIGKWKFTEIKSLWDRQYCTEGVFRVYQLSIAILLLTQQCNFNQYQNEVLENFFIPFLSILSMETHAPLENSFDFCSIGVFFIIGLASESKLKIR